MAPPVSFEETSIEADAILDAAIQFHRPLAPNLNSPRAVCLTGATGFLGAYLLDALLRTTDAQVHCVVRADDARAALERITAHLKSYQLWNEEFAGRIQPVAGDLAKPRFGLSEDRFHDLAASTDVIYHSAGRLNMAFPYSRLKSSNVLATTEVLRLAGLEQTKPVHFLSSMVVFFSDAHAGDRLLREGDRPCYHSSLKGGYSKSKWVADRLVAGAQKRGLPACIYRPVRIMGHSRTGAMNDATDILPLLLKGCILLGKFPALDIKVTMVPVDIISRAMMHLSRHQNSWGRAFHFFHPDPIEWCKLMSIFKDFGYRLEEVSYEQWWRALKQQLREGSGTIAGKNCLSSLMLSFTAPHFLFFKRPPLDASNTRQALEEAGIVYPAIDHSLIGTYVEYWQKTGYLPRPAC